LGRRNCSTRYPYPVTTLACSLYLALVCIISSPTWAAESAPVPAQTGPATAPNPAPASSAAPAPTNTAATADLTTDADYQQQLADWHTDSHVRRVDNRTFLLYPNQNNHQIGTMILFADWTLSATLVELANQVSAQGYDCILILPFPQQLEISLLATPEPLSETTPSPAVSAVSTAIPAPAPAPAEPNPLRQALLDEWSHQLTQIQTLKSSAPGHTIWVSQGNHAAWLAQLLPLVEKQSAKDAPEAIILLDAFTADPVLNQGVADALVTWSQPVLDLYQQQGPLQLLQAASLRANKVKQQNKLTWRQREMMPSDRSVQIVGWLRHLGWQ